MSGYKRAQRVSGEIHAALGQIILLGLKDPRITPISITRVQVSDDLRTAHVNFTPLGGSGDIRSIVKGLRAARGFIRRELARRIRTRYVPELRFHVDEDLPEAFRMIQLLGSMEQERKEQEEAAALDEASAPIGSADDPVGPAADDPIGPAADDPIGPAADDPVGPAADDQGGSES